MEEGGFPLHPTEDKQRQHASRLWGLWVWGCECGGRWSAHSQARLAQLAGTDMGFGNTGSRRGRHRTSPQVRTG